MAYAVQQNVTGQKLRFLLVDSITHIPGVAGLDTSTFTLWLSKAGGVLAATAGGPVYEEGRGWYHYVCQAADLDTAGVLGLSVSAPGCDPCDVEFFVTAYDPTVTTPVGAGSFIAQMQARGIGTGLTTTQWNQVYADALAMYSRYRPRTLLSTLTTVAGQEFYDLPTGGNLVKAVAPWGVYSEFQDIGLSVDEAMLQAAIGGGYTFAFDLPSLTDLYHQKLEAIIRQWGGSFDQDPSGGKVRLLPRPTDVETLAVLYTA
jgi:hypothetical protein